MFDDMSPPLTLPEALGRIAELQAKVAWLEGKSLNFCGTPWDQPYEDGRIAGREERQEEIDTLEALLKSARANTLRVIANMVPPKGVE